MALVIPRLEAIGDPRTKFLRCRVCGRRFRNDDRGLERLYDHLEARHPCDVYGFWHEVELAEEQAARELTTIKEAKWVVARPKAAADLKRMSRRKSK